MLRAIANLCAFLLLVVWSACSSSDPTGSDENTDSVREPRTDTHTYRFNNESEIEDWFKRDVGSWWIEQGRLVLEADPNQRVLMDVQSDDGYSGDVDISVDTQWLSGDGRTSYGVSFRVSRSGQYGFNLYAGQAFSVSRWGGLSGIGGSRPNIRLVGVTSDSTVVVNRGQNKLRVKTEGSRLLFYVNDKMVADVTDESFKHGKIGLYVGGNERVAFDNLVIVNTYTP